MIRTCRPLSNVGKGNLKFEWFPTVLFNFFFFFKFPSAAFKPQSKVATLNAVSVLRSPGCYSDRDRRVSRPVDGRLSRASVCGCRRGYKRGGGGATAATAADREAIT